MINKIPIPSFLKPILHEINFRFFNGQSTKIYDAGSLDLQYQWMNILKNSEDTLKNISEDVHYKNILFVTGYGVMGHHQAIEPTIIMSLFVRNCKVSSLYCNVSLPSCEFNLVGNNWPKSLNVYRKGITKESIIRKCVQCKSNIESIYHQLPIDLKGLDLFLNTDDYILAEEISRSLNFKDFRSFKYDDIAVGEEAFASILRVTLMGEVKDTKINRHLVQRYIMSGILTTIGYEKAFKKMTPDRIVCVHGVYQTHGLAVKVAHKLNIPVIVLGGGGIRKDTIIVCHYETYHHQLVNESNKYWENRELTVVEQKRTLQYAVKKRNSGHGADYMSYHPNPIEDEQQILNFCKIDKSRKIISLFTNVIWDAQIFYEGNAFKDIFEWLFLTIDTLGKNDNIWLVIRIHPAESKGGLPTNQPMLAEINNRYPKLPFNVKVISPESDLSSYTLASMSHENKI